MKRNLWILLTLVFVLVLGACTPASPAQQPVTTPTAGPTQEIPMTNAIGEAAALALATQLGIAVDQAQVSNVESVEWPNACLGAAQPDEMCAEVITPGYRVTVTVNGQDYEVHTNADGTSVRVVTAEGQLSEPSAQALAVAAAALAQRLAVLPTDITVVSAEAVDWTDSCLGLGGPAELCLAAITPGFRVIMEVGGQSYEVRTNADGSFARVNDQGQAEIPVGPLATALTRAIDALAQQVGVGPTEARLVSAQPMDWPDSCLGLGRADEGCMQAITPGYQFILEINGVNYEVRTDREGQAARVAGEASGQSGAVWPENTENMVITWRREGGIAGLCDQVAVFTTGEVIANACQGNRPIPAGGFFLSEDQQAQLNQWNERFASFEYSLTDPAVADAMSTVLVFTGAGSDVADQAAQEEMAAFVAGLFAEASGR